MTGIYVRVERDRKAVNVELDEMSSEEISGWLESKSWLYIVSLVRQLLLRIHRLEAESKKNSKEYKGWMCFLGDGGQVRESKGLAEWNSEGSKAFPVLITVLEEEECEH